MESHVVVESRKVMDTHVMVNLEMVERSREEEHSREEERTRKVVDSRVVEATSRERQGKEGEKGKKGVEGAATEQESADIGGDMDGKKKVGDGEVGGGKEDGEEVEKVPGEGEEEDGKGKMVRSSESTKGKKPGERASMAGTEQASTDSVDLLKRRLTPGKSREMSLSRMRELSGMSKRPLSPSGPGATWDHEMLNKSQFVQLVELFVGRDPDDDLVDSITNYIKGNYTEAEIVISTLF